MFWWQQRGSGRILGRRLVTAHPKRVPMSYCFLALELLMFYLK